MYLFSSTRRISRRKQLPLHKYAVCTLGPEPALDTFTLTDPSAAVSVFCQLDKLEATVRFYYKKTSQKRSGYKPLLAFMIFFSPGGVFTVSVSYFNNSVNTICFMSSLEYTVVPYIVEKHS